MITAMRRWQQWLLCLNTPVYGMYLTVEAHATLWVVETSICDCSCADTWPQMIRVCSYPGALWGPLTLLRSFLLKIISPKNKQNKKKQPEVFSQSEKARTVRKRGAKRVRERDREGGCQVGPPPPPPPVRVSRLHAPLLSRCPDNVPAFIRAHLLFREGGRSGIRGCVLRKKVGRKKKKKKERKEKKTPLEPS